VGGMYWTCASGLEPAGGVRVEAEPVGWRTGGGACGSTVGKDPPRTRLVTRPLPSTGVTLTGPGEGDEDRYPPPAETGRC